MTESEQPRGTESLVLPDFDDDDTLLSDEIAPHPRPRFEWTRDRIVIASIAAAVLLALIGGIIFAIARGRTPQYTYTSIQQGNLALSVAATGPIQSAEYDVNFSGSGTITEINVKVGQQVKAGDTLAKLDPTSLQDAVNSAQQNLSSAQQSLSDAQSNLQRVQEQAQAQVNAAFSQEQNTINNTCNKSSDSSSCIQAAQDQYAAVQAQANAQQAQAQSQVDSAQAQVNSAQSQLQTAQDNLKNATLVAPHAGTVAAINGTVGGTPGKTGTAGGSSASQSSTFISIVDLSMLQVNASVNEADIGRVAAGQAVTFMVSAYGTRTFSGTVSAISPLGQTTSNVVTYPVTIDVDMPSVQGANLLPGMTATATITTDARFGVLLLPASAVTFAQSQVGAPNGITRAQAQAALQQANKQLQALENDSANVDVSKDTPTRAFVLERSSTDTWIVKPVVLGLTDGTSYQVLSGLHAGEHVVTGQQGGTGSRGASTPNPASGGQTQPGAASPTTAPATPHTSGTASPGTRSTTPPDVQYTPGTGQ